MKALFAYTLEVNLYLLLFAGAYFLLFRKETYHRLNRAIILFTLILALVLPLINLPVDVVTTYKITLNTLVIGSENEQNIPTARSGNILMAIYLLGLAFSAAAFVYGLLQLLIMRAKGKRININGVNLIESGELKSPASFYNTIFWSPEIPQESVSLVLAHELVHIREKHSLDILFLNLIRIICWYNPAIYFLGVALKANHEYRADEVVSSAEKDKASYARVLIAQAFSVNPLLLQHSFSNKNLLKNRIIMMNKQTNSNVSAIKYLALIPLVATALFIHGCTKEDSATTTQNEGAQNQQTETELTEGMAPAEKIEGTDVYKVAEVMPQFQSGKNDLMRFLGENIVYPAACKAEGIEGTVFLRFIIDETGRVTKTGVMRSPDERLSTAALETLSKMPDWQPGKHNGNPVKVQYVLPIQYKLK